MTLGEVVKPALLAGLVAGVVAATFHWILTEPLIDRAVKIEEQAHAASGGAPSEPTVSRTVQKFGLFVGFLLYGAAWGILLGLLIFAARSLFAEMSAGKQGFLLALVLGWSVALFPLLKYPANPPGIGEAATVGYRQEFYLICVALSLIGTVAVFWAERWVRRSQTGRVVVVVCYTVYLVSIFLALPSNSDANKLSPELIRNFRALSLLGQVLFWGVMGGAFWSFTRMSHQAPPRRS